MPIIVPLDVAVCDPDLMWRVDHLNAARAVNVRDFGTVMDAVQELTEGHPSVLLVGPDGIELALDDLEQALPEHPEWKTVFVVDTGDHALVDQVMSAGATTVIDVGEPPEAVAEVALGLLPVDRDAVAAEEAEAEALEREGRPGGKPSTADIVIVTSPKGGEGVTTVAANLARALASGGLWRVALVEGDPSFGDLTILLDLPEPVHYDIDQIGVIDSDVVARLSAFDPDAGVRVIRAPLGWRVGELPIDFALDLIDAVGAEVDVVVVDAPFALARQAELCAEAASVLIVATRKTVNIKNALVAARALGRPAKLAVVLNETGRHRHDDLEDQAEDAIGVDVIGSLPYEGKLDRSGSTMSPHVLAPPRSHFSKAIAEIADDLRRSSFGDRRRAEMITKVQ